MAVAAGLALLPEALRDGATSGTPVVVAQAIALAGIVIASATRAGLRTGALVAIVACFLAAWLAVDLATGWNGDQDPHQVYRAEGHMLLHGHAPHAEYPPGAVVLFAAETALGDGSPVVPNAVLMGLCLLACVAAIARLETPVAPWLATVVGVAPAAAYFVFFRFDAAPAAALLVGLVLAGRGRWRLAGLALGVGAALKWTPALAVLPLAAWLVGRRRARDAVALVAAAIGAFVALNLPLFVLDPSSVFSSYRSQAGRSITGESLWALPLAAVGRLDRSMPYWQSGVAPRWADSAAVAVQLGIVAAATLWAARRGSLHQVLAIAALLPAAFLLTNKIFSAQFVVPIAAATCFAGALVLRARGAARLLAVATAALLSADALVYPFRLGSYFDEVWPASLIVFVVALGAMIAVLRSIRAGPGHEASTAVPAGAQAR